MLLSQEFHTSSPTQSKYAKIVATQRVSEKSRFHHTILGIE